MNAQKWDSGRGGDTSGLQMLLLLTSCCSKLTVSVTRLSFVQNGLKFGPQGPWASCLPFNFAFVFTFYPFSIL